MARRLVFPAKQQVQVEEFESPALGAQDVRIATRYSLMSTGTENIIFNAIYEPGSHWDNWIRWPFIPGYLAVGEVVETGPEVSRHRVGDTVAVRRSHSSEHVIDEESAHPVPAGIDARDATWFGLAKIAFMGARAAEYFLGDTLLVIGAGPIGQMTVRWAKAAGVARIMVVDPVAMRLDLAARGGATHGIAKSITECRDEILAAGHGKLPRVVNDATGNVDVFAEALTLAADRGRVVILGDTGTPTGQHLTQDVIRRGLSIVGAHDNHSTPEWNDATINALFFDLVLQGRFDLDGLITDTFAPEECAAAYGKVNQRRGETMGVVFDWSR